MARRCYVLLKVKTGSCYHVFSMNENDEICLIDSSEIRNVCSCLTNFYMLTMSLKWHTNVTLTLMFIWISPDEFDPNPPGIFIFYYMLM